MSVTIEVTKLVKYLRNLSRCAGDIEDQAASTLIAQQAQIEALTSTIAGLEVDAERWRARDQVKLNISLGELKASNGTRWQVCLTRDDMPNDAWPTRTWMFSVFDTAIKEDAEHEVKEWKRFLRAETPKYPQRCEVVDAAISRARG